jgi:hypothetical protein
MRCIVPVTLSILVLGMIPSLRGASESDPLLAKLRAVGKEGAGNAEANRAWQELVQQGPKALLPALTALDEAEAITANWLRSAVDAIAEKELAAGRPLPRADLEAFVKDTKHNGRARRLAYELLVRVDPAAPDRLLPGMLHDPSTELRRDAVAVVLKEAQLLLEQADRTAATAAFRRALDGARDRDQVDAIAKQLKDLGVTIDLATHFGFVQSWRVVGPFDNTGGIGFAREYPPEKGVDSAASYAGKQEKPLRWVEHTTEHPYGIVDLNKALGKNMGATAYAHTVVVSPREQPVQIRAASANAVKIFLNGKLLFFREEYHHGMRMDQHVAVGTLGPGRNEILIKVCQNEQKDDWAQNWSFQLRVADAVGGAVPLKVETVKTQGQGGEGKVQP